MFGFEKVLISEVSKHKLTGCNGQLSLNAKPNSHLAAKYDTNQKQKNPGHFWKKDYPVRHFTSALTRPRAIPKKGKLLKIYVS